MLTFPADLHERAVTEIVSNLKERFPLCDHAELRSVAVDQLSGTWSTALETHERCVLRNNQVQPTRPRRLPPAIQERLANERQKHAADRAKDHREALISYFVNLEMPAELAAQIIDEGILAHVRS